VSGIIVEVRRAGDRVVMEGRKKRQKGIWSLILSSLSLVLYSLTELAKHSNQALALLLAAIVAASVLSFILALKSFKQEDLSRLIPGIAVALDGYFIIMVIEVLLNLI
jgi:glucose uptake protein GlcU